jgi:integrase
MAWIEKRSGNYRVMWREPDGSKRSRTFPTRADARAAKAEIETAIARGTYVEQDRLKEPFIEYLQAVYAGDLTIREVTRAKYETVVRLHLGPAVGSTSVGDLTPPQMRRVFAKLHDEAGPWTTWEAFKITRRAVRQALQEGLLTRDPLAGVKVTAPRRKGIRILTPAEVETIADWIELRYQALVLLSAYGGLSIGELGALKRDDLNHDCTLIRVDEAVSTPNGQPEIGPPKAESRARVVTVPRWVAKILAEHLLRYPGEFVFTTPSGGIVTHLNIRRAWRAACDAAFGAGFEARFHDLRHTAVALLIQEGAHPKLIQARMGHSSITMTMDTYGHLFPTADAELAASLEKFSPAENSEKVVNLRGPHERDHHRRRGAAAPVLGPDPEVGR